MAAHLKTGLEQVLKGETTKEILRGAVDISCWTEDDWFTWTHVDQFVKGKISEHVFMNFMHEDLARATKEWERLGKPATREEWHEAKYGS